MATDATLFGPAGEAEPEAVVAVDGRLVEVAVDAPAGAGPRTFTYLLPPALDDLAPGEAVLVPFGKGGRQSLGVALDEPHGVPSLDPASLRPVAARVRADGPLLPPLTLALARWIADHYLAPVAIVLRAMLPPGMLERLEVIAEVVPAGEAALRDGRLDAAALDLLDELGARARPVRDLASPEGRGALLRRLRSLESGGLVELTPTLVTAAPGPRYERLVRLTAAGEEAQEALATGAKADGRPPGPRQAAAMADLATTADGRLGGQGRLGSELVDRHGSSPLAGLARRGLVETWTRERPRRPLSARPPGLRGGRPPGSELSGPQADAFALVRAAIGARDATPLLLDGVTGGGKTAVYVEAIAEALDAGRRALVLVPEIALAMPLVDRLRADLAVRVALVHSGLSDGERADEWRRIRAGDVDLVVGTRTAVLAPLDDVGLVIVDEEHDPAYKSDRTPRFMARDTSIRLAELAGAAVILGSATPSVESVGHARAGRYRRVALPDRASGTPPEITLVDLRAELAEGNRGLLSRVLRDALAALDVGAGDQAILVINRRGSASVVLCRDCGHVQACPDCDRPLVYHHAGTTLRCHHCGRASPLADRCPACGSPRIRYLGGGTERLEREVRGMFPRFRVDRLDRDVVERRGAAVRVIDGFTAGQVDVLVGTSLATKGLDIPTVTLVGIVSADVALNLPDERAAERTYQVLAQAIGRAGRGERAGHAVVQTYRPEHRAIRAVVERTADTFYDEELALRERWGSPPFGRLVKLTIGLPDRDSAEHEAQAMAARLRSAAGPAGVLVTGPAPAYIARRADRWRFNVVLRGSDPAALLGDGVPAPWSVDVDPESLL
jgi:primosomal protein N' (replication factor Y)